MGMLSTDCSHAARSNTTGCRRWRNAVRCPPVAARAQLNVSDDMTVARKNAHSCSTTTLSDTVMPPGRSLASAIAVQWGSCSEWTSHAIIDLLLRKKIEHLSAAGKSKVLLILRGVSCITKATSNMEWLRHLNLSDVIVGFFFFPDWDWDSFSTERQRYKLWVWSWIDWAGRSVL